MAAFLVPAIAMQLALLYDLDVYNDEDNDDDEPVRIRPFVLDGSFNVETFSEEYCVKQFRFTCPQLKEIIEVLGIPPRIKTYGRDNVDSLTVLCMVIYRLSYPARLDRMEEVFKRSAPAISRLVNHLIKWTMLRWNQLLIWDHHRLTPAKLEEYADLCYEASDNECNAVIGFIDGTVHEINRPVIGQQSVFNGHKHIHALKYQSIMAPDGIILHLSKAFTGTTHDLTIYQQSGIIDILEEHAFDTAGGSLALYGDSAYMPDPHMIIGYTDANPTEDQARFNKTMSGLRIIVEWGFKEVTTYFSGMDFPKSHRLLSTCVESHYRFAVLMTNIHTCYYGNQINMQFGVDPPTLQEYIRPEAMAQVME